MRTFDFASRRGRLTPLLSLVLAVGLLMGLGADSLSAQAPGGDSIPHYNLDSLVVSVLRTPVELGESPYPISVAGQRELQQGKTGMYLEEALETLPGVQVQNRFNYAVGERVTIRGFGSRAQFGVRGIHVIVDEIPATLPDGQSTLDHLDIGSLGRVEALRGPASALYGNASGGVLRFETQIPTNQSPLPTVTAVGGSDGLLRLESTAAGTVGEGRYLLNLNRLSYDGFRNHPSPAQEHYGSADRLHFNGRMEHPLGSGTLGITINHLDLDAENPGALTRADLMADREQILDFYYTNFGTGKEVQQSQLGLTWTGPVGGISSQTTVYGIVRDFLNPIPFRVIDADRRALGFRTTLSDDEIAGNSMLGWLGGFEIDYQDDDRQEYGNAGGDPDPDDPQLRQDESVRSVGLFAQGSLEPVERVRLVAGVRYDHFRFDVEDRFFADPPPSDDTGDRTMDSWSPTVGVSLDATPWLDVFGSYSTFFETPTTVELANQPDESGGFNPSLDPQTGWTVEGGVRGSFRDRFSYEVAVFSTEVDDELIEFETDPGGVTYYRNAGSSSRDGVEAVLRAQLYEGLTTQLSYTYIDAQFDEYVVDGDDFSGNEVPGFAPQELQASLRYGRGPWYVEVGADYTDEIPVDDANSESADSYTLLDARVGGESLGLGGLQISPFAGIRNLTDELYSASVTVNAFGGRFYEPGPGRTYYVGISTAFGGD